MKRVALLSILFVAACSSDQPHAVVFDIPKIVQLNKNEIIHQLGSPKTIDTLTSVQIKQDIDQTITYDKDGFELTIDVSPKTGRFVRAFLSPSSNEYIDAYGLDSLREAGNLDALPVSFRPKPQDVQHQGKTVYTGYHVLSINE